MFCADRRRNGASKDNGSNQDTEDTSQNLEDRKSGDADAEGYTDLSSKRTAGRRGDPIAERSKMKLGSQRAEGATLKTFHRGKTRRKEGLSDDQDPSNSKDVLPTTPRTVEAGESGISGRERIDKCLEQKNGSTKNLKIRTPNQDGVKKNHELGTENASVSAKRKNSKLKQDGVSSRIKLCGRSAAENAKLRISGQLGPQVKPKAIVNCSKVESKSLKHHEVKNAQKQKSFCQHEQQGCGEVDQHDSMPRGLKRKGRIMDRDKECEILKQEENRKNCKPSSIRVDENSINEPPLLDRSVKKLNANKRKTEQDNVQKELQPNIKYAKEETKMQAAKQVKSVKKKKPTSATKNKSQAPSPSSTGRAQELSARRLRVMRSLEGIAFRESWHLHSSGLKLQILDMANGTVRSRAWPAPLGLHSDGSALGRGTC
ncbi:hypothetical protein NL676_026065 [Syzygium grande]|nr:hypothetical protein NL676_026065 [Syzygium grande]